MTQFSLLIHVSVFARDPVSGIAVHPRPRPMTTLLQHQFVDVFCIKSQEYSELLDRLKQLATQVTQKEASQTVVS